MRDEASMGVNENHLGYGAVEQLRECLLIIKTLASETLAAWRNMMVVQDILHSR